MFNPASAPFNGNVPTEPAQGQIPVAPPVAPPVTSQVESVDTENYDDVAQTIEIGQKVSDFPIDKYRAIKGKIDRIAVLTRKWKAVKSHYEKGMGNFYCFDGTCCQSESGRAKRRYLVPILVYETDVKGNLLTKAVNVQYLVLSSVDYEPLSMADSAQPLNTLDLKVLCEEEKYQKKSFMPVPGQALWLQDEAFKAAVVTEYKRLEPFILKAFARKLGRTPEEAQENYLKSKKTPAIAGFDSSQVNTATADFAQAGASPVSPVSENFDIDSLLGQ